MNKAKFEDILRNVVYRAGKLAERLIEQFSKVSAKPILSLEGQIQIAKLKEIILNEADKVFTAAIPSLIDKTALEIRGQRPKLCEKFKEKGASIIVHVDMDTGPGSYEGEAKDIFTCKSSVEKLPFEDSFFDLITANLANQFQKDISSSIREIGRLLAFGGEAVIADFHPFGLFAKKGSMRLRPLEAISSSLEDYYKNSRQAGLKIMDVKELFIGEKLRDYFITDEEKSAFRMAKGSPLLIFLFVKKV